MRLIFSFLSLASLGFGGWYTWENVEPVRKFVQERVQTGEFQTLEMRYSAEQIMKANKETLLKNQGYTFLEPKLFFYPYLLMDVKYSQAQGATGEGLLLWGLNDGEMVINTSTWERTHGFEDCLLAKANKNDFKILEALIEAGGALDREKLYVRFKGDQDIVDDWIDNCREKKLIVISGNKFRLHFQNPRLQVQPTTQIDQLLVTQPARYTDKVKARYSASQIMKLTQTAFGNDFTVRRTQEVFLPVYCLSIQNPDGSMLTTYWNALNGQKLDPAACR